MQFSKRPGGPNYAEQYRDLARQLARRYGVMEGVVGVVLIGGLTFGEADRYGDVDLIVYLREQSLRTWYFGEAPLPAGESIYRGLRLDVSYLEFQSEMEREWRPIDLWNVSRADILYDPEGLIRELIAGKLEESASTVEQQALERATYIRLLLDRIVPGWLYRGESASAHHALNRAADQLLGLVHLINRELVPGDDWNLKLIDDLTWKPSHFRERIAKTLVARAVSAEEASRRRYELGRLLQECWHRMAPDEALEESAHAVSQRRMLHAMAREGAMPLEEYLSRYSRTLLIRSPAYDLLTIDRSGETPLVRFNEQRLRHLINHELGRFLDHQQRLLRELAQAGGTDIDS